MRETRSFNVATVLKHEYGLPNSYWSDRGDSKLFGIDCEVGFDNADDSMPTKTVEQEIEHCWSVVELDPIRSAADRKADEENAWFWVEIDTCMLHGVSPAWACCYDDVTDEYDWRTEYALFIGDVTEDEIFYGSLIKPEPRLEDVIPAAKLKKTARYQQQDRPKRHTGSGYGIYTEWRRSNRRYSCRPQSTVITRGGIVK